MRRGSSTRSICLKLLHRDIVNKVIWGGGGKVADWVPVSNELLVFGNGKAVEVLRSTTIDLLLICSYDDRDIIPSSIQQELIHRRGNDVTVHNTKNRSGSL